MEECNQSKCWNWFRAADQQRGGGEPSLIAGITTKSCGTIRLIQSASMSADCPPVRPLWLSWERPTTTCMLRSGSIPASPTGPLLTCLRICRHAARRRPRLQGHFRQRAACPGNYLFHGDRDTTVHPNNGGQVLEQAIGTTSTRKSVHRGQIPGGHAYTRTTHTDAGGREILEHWNIHGAADAWSGGNPAGS
jgi:hypothetical protein